MKKFVIERIMPGASNLSKEELENFVQSCCKTIVEMNVPYHWIQSFVTDDKIFCIHIAESEELVREHSRRSCIPVHKITEVRKVIDSKN